MDDMGYTKAEVHRKGDNRIKVEIPGEVEKNPDLEVLGNSGEIYFILGIDNIEYVGPDEETGKYRYALLKPWEEIESAGDIVLGCSDILSAEAGWYNEYGMNQYVVTLRFNDSGRVKFAEATGSHIGETIAIVYNGEIICAPVIQQPLTEGVA